MSNHFIILFLSILVFSSCSSNKNNSTSSSELSPGELILKKTVKAHGGKKYDTAHFSFVFRGNKYSFKNNKGLFTYTSTKEKNGKTIVDILENGVIKRTIDGVEKNLSEKEKIGYSGSLNSVIYFATLPHKLQDKAVKKAHKGSTKINGQSYEVLEISFEQEGGGRDHDDVFHYWINQKTNIIDYLAYNYQVNGGGVRFRSAYNSRKVDGIVFQDYVNYKAKVGTPLADLPKLYESGQLKELSRIETEEVKSLKTF